MEKYKIKSINYFFVLLGINFFSLSFNAEGASQINTFVDWFDRKIKCIITYSEKELEIRQKSNSDNFLNFREQIIFNIEETFLKLNFDNSIKIRELIITGSSDEELLKRKLSENLICNPKNLSDGSFRVYSEIALSISFLQKWYPKNYKAQPLVHLVCPTCGQPWPLGKEVPDGFMLASPSSVPSKVATGFIIETRGIKFEPAFFPRIINEDGKEVFGPGFVSWDEIGNSEMVSYCIDKAQSSFVEKTGDHPLRIKALGISGFNRTDLVISNQDAMLIHGNSLNLKVLEKCKVLILIDDPESVYSELPSGFMPSQIKNLQENQ